jgi:peptide/nickel transport system substrate-binding protein
MNPAFRLRCVAMMMRRHSLSSSVLSLALAGAALMLSGCGKSETDALDAAVIGAGPLTLGDALAPAAGTPQEVLRLNIAQGLVRFDAGGQIEPGLAERWTVSDDGLSYIFRLAADEWPDGRKIMARDIARILKRQLRNPRGSATRDALGAVEDVVAMTDRVIEIRLAAPRPNLLELLAQPDLALIRDGVGSGPFRLRTPAAGKPGAEPDATVQLRRRLPGVDGEPGEREDVALAALAAQPAIAAFVSGKLDLLLGGTVNDLPLVQRAKLPRGALHFDPANGLFGLVPAKAGGALADADVRRLLSQAIDRAGLVAALGVPGLGPRATVLQSGLDGLPDPAQPAWLALPIAERRAALRVEAQRLFDDGARPHIRVALPQGPGGDLLFARLSADWRAIGIESERVAPGAPADLAWVDAVAPSSSPGWYLRQFRCGVAPICNAEADSILDAARTAPDPTQRGALFADAAFMIDQQSLFIAIAAPVRWSLVGDRATGYQDNRFARHPFADIMRRPPRGY